MKLIEVRVKEKANFLFDYPTRYRYQKWWENPDGTITPVGGSAIVKTLFGEFECCGNSCLIIGEIDESRYMEADRFEEI